ncbi:single-stranded-DNA-specific exonuclease RecJ [Weizmannia acidilactici]|uniref:Single-stranded-DNA-specific exonuclease RecJ n=1 Tax=Weizmannia acidilactici TaxID=2607726 RepID=A0A5J4JBL2_9BACI|nr:single-stranded-DNA-specific exonuclease RecJ [Weizmannia acidilactici]GER69141.1 single-stranded-DNA-specific exonuclease RecJ [Weizmannia acidilactici]
MLQPKTRWLVPDGDPEAAKKLSHQLNISPLISKLLVNRGITDIEEARSFLFHDGAGYHDPLLMHDMEKAVRRIKKAIEREEPILVFGDYDADGVTSTAVMMTVLKELGAKAQFYIPDRFKEGYGPNEAAFRRAAAEGFQVIITVDTGIAAVHEAAVAQELGITLIITDHHEPGPVLPEAYAIVHPKHPKSTYPFRELSGAGVAFKVAHALYGKVPEHLEELACIGTIADLVPLLGENRLIAVKGIKRLRTTKRPGLAAICRCADINQAQINEETIAFALAPRLNVAGRLEHAALSADLLLTEDKKEAETLASAIDGLNKERQKIVNDITKEAIEMVGQEAEAGARVLVAGKEGWNAGVIGIVASRLVERFYRPAIVLSFDSEKGLAKGSARSIDGFHMFNELSKCCDILPHFGGHPMAAGMTLSISDVGELRKRLNQQAEALPEEIFVPVTKIGAEISAGEAGLEAIRELALLSPFGTANPKPLFLLDGVECPQTRQIGADGKHLKLLFSDGRNTLDGVGFGLGDLAPHISPGAKTSVVGELSINEWNNIRKPQIIVKDVKIDSWQLFDIRGRKPLKQWVRHVPEEGQAFIVFQKETLQKLPLGDYPVRLVPISTMEEAKAFDAGNKNIVFLDLPPDAGMMEALLNGGVPSRIYAYFYHVQDHFFSTFPTRDHFKWFYAFLAKRKTFNLKRYGDELAAYRGWSRNTIDFISQVFFELDFVTINDGLISLKAVNQKRDLQESFTYQRKQAQYQMEKDLLYSSFHELKMWFDHLIKPAVQYEEETAQWI